MNIPQIYRDKIASSMVGTPGVDTSGAQLSAEISQNAGDLAKPIWDYVIKEQQAKDESQYNSLMAQHKTNIMQAAEDIKIQYAGNPDEAGPALMKASQNSIKSVQAQATNPRVKMAMAKGDSWSETWGLKEMYGWAATQNTNNIIQHSATVADGGSKRLAEIGADLTLTPEDMVLKMAPEMSILSNELNSIKSSKHPELADKIERAAAFSYAKSMLDGAIETQPWKANALLANPEFRKLMPPDELLSYQKTVETAVKGFPEKQINKQILQNFAEHPEVVQGVLTGKIGWSELDSVQRKKPDLLSPQAWQSLKDIALNREPEAARESRETIRAQFFAKASDLGFKLSNDPTQLANKDATNKYIKSQKVEELYAFRDSILSAQARGLIDKGEAQRYLGWLYIPMVAKVMQRHDPNLWDKIVGGGKNIMEHLAGPGGPVGAIFHVGDPRKVDDFQNASKVIDEFLVRKGLDKDFINRSSFYDAYLKEAERVSKTGAKKLDNTPWSPTDLAHAAVGEGLGSLVPTPLGQKPITHYDPKTGEPQVTFTPEEDEKLNNMKALNAIHKSKK